MTGRDGDVTVLDVGCGAGELVAGLASHGWTAFGCDFPGVTPASEALRDIELAPYRLPFDDQTFDLVVSTSVLEHAQNKEACFREVHRVLRPGGYAMHLFPPKHYLLLEPHVLVPLLSWFWPRYPTWWVAIWARLGIRNVFQREMSWREVVKDNERYFRTKLSYWTTPQYRHLSTTVFGNCAWPMRFYVDHADGGAARLVRTLPLKALLTMLVRETRESFLLHRRDGDG